MSFQLLTVLTVLVAIARSSNGVPLNEFFPFGENHGDTDLRPLVQDDLDDGSSPAVPLHNPFRFFGSSHSALYVNINGAVSFNGPIPKYTPTCDPLSVEMSMIAPFWADVDLRTQGNITFRQTTDATVLSKALGEIRAAFPNVPTTESLKWAFIATWSKVGFYGEQITRVNSSNTFQMAMVTDGLNSFAIFMYNDIEWTTGTASHGDSHGLGGQPARAGFDDGKGHLSILGGSCTNKIINITSLEMANGPGKFVFQVDQGTIVGPGSSTLKVITVTDRDVTTHPGTDSSETPTPSPDDIKKRKDDLEDRLKKLRIRVMADCDKLIERPALERECYIELENVNNLLHELKLTKYWHELIQIEKEVERINMVMDRIEQDISYRLFGRRFFK